MKRYKKYGAILIDPAWSYKPYKGVPTIPSRAEVKPYEVMEYEDLARLPIKRMAAKNCVLFMWTFGTFMEQAIRLGRRYGFKYSTVALTWVKTCEDGEPRMGMGHWTRQEDEFVLLFTKGKPHRKDDGKDVRQTMFGPRRDHSRKPDETYERIMRLVEGPYVEIFARQRYPGWAQELGNQEDLGQVGRWLPPPEATGPLLDIMLGKQLERVVIEV